jgi:hypothetical protein
MSLLSVTRHNGGQHCPAWTMWDHRRAPQLRLKPPQVSPSSWYTYSRSVTRQLDPHGLTQMLLDESHLDHSSLPPGSAGYSMPHRANVHGRGQSPHQGGGHHMASPSSYQFTEHNSGARHGEAIAPPTNGARYGQAIAQPTSGARHGQAIAQPTSGARHGQAIAHGT